MVKNRTNVEALAILLLSVTIYRISKKRKDNSISSEDNVEEVEENYLTPSTSMRSFVPHRHSYEDIRISLANCIPPDLYSLERQNTISQVDDCHVTTTTNNWNHFECFQKESDNGYHVNNPLHEKLGKNWKRSYNRYASTESNDEKCSTHWEIAMSNEDYSSSSNELSSNSAGGSTQKTTNQPNGIMSYIKHLCKKFKKVKEDRFAKIMPNKLILIRHGESEGNVSQNIYATKPDNSLTLTKLGWEQARLAGKALKESIIGPNESIHFIVSPYVRTVETFHGILAAWVDPSEFSHIFDKDDRTFAWYKKCFEMGITWSEDPRIREQDFGNYQDIATIKKAKEERHEFGPFYYRFPHGESASDVFDRVSTFLDSLWRSFDSKKTKNYVIVTHGISIRVFLARYFRYTIDQFSILSNPKNAEMIVLGHDGNGKLTLDGRSELIMERHEDAITGESTNLLTGYTFHKKLRVLPAHFRRRREVKLSYND